MEWWRYSSRDSCLRQLMQLFGQLYPTATLLPKDVHPASVPYKAGWVTHSVRMLRIIVKSLAHDGQRTVTPLWSRIWSTFRTAYITSSKEADSCSPSKETPSPARNPKFLCTAHGSFHKTPLRHPSVQITT
jgi:hypothetical protein